MASSPITSWQINGENVETVSDFVFLGSKITHMVTAATKLSYNKPRQCIKKQRYHFADKGPYSQSYSFPRSHVRMWILDHKEGWALKKWCFQAVVLEKILESPLDFKQVKAVHPLTLNTHWKDWCWSLSANTLATWCEELIHLKRPWWWERLRAGGEGNGRGWDGWMISLTQRTWVWANLGDGERQGSLACCCPWGFKDSDMTEHLNKFIMTYTEL